MDLDEQVLCRMDEVGDASSRGFSVRIGNARLEIFVVRRGDEIFGYRNNCPHIGAPLEWSPDEFLDVDGQFIQCAMHGALFTVEDGYCVWGPCAGQRLRRVPLQVDDGAVKLRCEDLRGS